VAACTPMNHEEKGEQPNGIYVCRGSRRDHGNEIHKMWNL